MFSQQTLTSNGGGSGSRGGSGRGGSGLGGGLGIGQPLPRVLVRHPLALGEAVEVHVQPVFRVHFLHRAVVRHQVTLVALLVPHAHPPAHRVVEHGRDRRDRRGPPAVQVSHPQPHLMVGSSSLEVRARLR